jgi:TPR repeat protein
MTTHLIQPDILEKNVDDFLAGGDRGYQFVDKICREENLEMIQQIYNIVKQHPDNPHAQNHIGWLYSSGIIFEKDYAKACEMWQKSALHGNQHSQFNLGHMYYYGIGATCDYTEAHRWFQMAADINDEPDSQYMLGMMYRYGEGVEVDYGKALIYYARSANKPNAQYFGGALQNLKNLVNVMCEKNKDAINTFYGECMAD